SESGAARRRSKDPPLPRLRREGLRHRRQPSHRPRSLARGSGQGTARGQSHVAGADRLDAPRVDAQEHRPARPRRPALTQRDLRRRGLGDPLVACAIARGPPFGGRDAVADGPPSLAPQRGLVMATRQQTVTVWQGRVALRIQIQGEGGAVVFFHGPWGLTWGPFLDALAKGFTVYAPEHPGTTPDQPDTVQHIDNLWDLVLCYDELLEQLQVLDVALVGHSFGAMVACEVAAVRPSRVKRLALIDPIGLWRDDAPVGNWMLLAPQDLPAHVFREPDGAAAKALFPAPENADDAALARTALIWAMGSTGKFIWPIHDKGLKKRMHRIEASTLLVWGENDRLVPFAYAEEFARRLPGARVEVVKGAGHAPHLEQPERAARLVQA